MLNTVVSGVVASDCEALGNEFNIGGQPMKQFVHALLPVHGDVIMSHSYKNYIHNIVVYNMVGPRSRLYNRNNKQLNTAATMDE